MNVSQIYDGDAMEPVELEIELEKGRQVRRPYPINARISAIVTRVYVLVTMMPRYSRSICWHPSRQTPLWGAPERGIHRYAIRGFGGLHSFRCTVKLMPP
jgi:hypothetical protein